MQDLSNSSENAEPEKNDPSDTADSDNDSTPPSTVLVEVLPGVAVVCGKVPAELKPGLIDFGNLVSATDRKRISAAVASIGNTATVAGNLANAYAGVQGLYKVSSATQALLNSGATLAVKDGANLGAVFLNGKIVAQARLIPVTTVSAAQSMAAIGPALAMVALQMQLNEVAGLVKTNIALTSQVLASIRNEQWSELTGLVATIDHAVNQAQEIGSVPDSLWDSIASSGALLNKQLELYRQNVSDHVKRIDRTDPHRRREYLQMNAEAIVFDAFAIVDSLKAWTGHQALRAGKAKAAGRKDPAEARLAELIARDTRTEFESALAETTSLVTSLTRELRLTAELPGYETLSLPGKQKEAQAARRISARLLEAIQPLADALRPPAPPLEAPDVVCAPKSLDHKPYLPVLRLFVEHDETLRVLGFPDQLDTAGPISAILGGAKQKLATALDRAGAKTLVAVTDRRIILARANAFVEQGEIRQDIPIDQVRYVRAATTLEKGARLAVDLITRDENFRWLFQADIDKSQVDALVSVLAESMTIPDAEREALQGQRYTAIEAGE